jgi:ABC-type nitrate/sulfonate/bicarbonate transport system substrate-binding protein
VQLQLAGIEVVVLTVDDVTPLPGPGLTVGESTLGAKRDALRAFTAATLRAMTEIIEDPEAGLESAVAEVPELGADRDTQRAILLATIDMWNTPYTDQNGLGAIDLDAWAGSIEFMRGLPQTTVREDLTVNDLVTEDLLP